jgi:hypothetical protein
MIDHNAVMHDHIRDMLDHNAVMLDHNPVMLEHKPDPMCRRRNRHARFYLSGLTLL